MIKEFLNPDKITLPIGRKLIKISPNPNVWTVVSFLPAIFGIISVYHKQVLWGLIFFTLAGLLDSIDGAVARCQGRDTHIGGYIDGVTDRFVDFLLIYSFLFLGLPDLWFPITWWVVIAAYFALMPTFTVAYSNHRQAVVDPSEKVIWRILHRSEMYPMLLFVLLAAIFNLKLASYILVITAVLSIITTFQTIILTIYKSKKYPQQ